MFGDDLWPHRSGTLDKAMADHLFGDPSDWDIFCLRNFDTFRRTSVRVSKMNAVARAQLTHWGRVTHICVNKLSTIGSDNGLSPSRCQAIVWTNAGFLSIGPLRPNFSEILFKIQQFSLTKMHLKMSSAKRRLCCLGPNVLTFQMLTLLQKYIFIYIYIYIYIIFILYIYLFSVPNVLLYRLIS